MDDIRHNNSATVTTDPEYNNGGTSTHSELEDEARDAAEDPLHPSLGIALARVIYYVAFYIILIIAIVIGSQFNSANLSNLLEFTDGDLHPLILANLVMMFAPFVHPEMQNIVTYTLG